MAGGSSASGGDEEIQGINVTPFVDIALVLLVIFMVTAKYLAAQSIPVDLPRASTAQSHADQTVVSVSIDAAQTVFVDARPVTEHELVAELRRRHGENAELRAVIAADRGVPHGAVTRVIDLVRRAGVTHFAIQTESSEEPEP